MPETYDLAVIGGGPGGAACALTAARAGLRVAIFERSSPAPDKPCGEGIMPTGADVLRDLGLHDVLARGRPFAGIRHVVAGTAPLEVDLPRPGIALPRPWLAEALEGALRASPCVDRMQGRVRVERSPVGFALDAGPRGAWAARTLAVADGVGGTAAAWMRDASGRRKPGGRFGLRARARAREALDRVEVHMGGGCEVYLTPLPGGVLNVAVLFEGRPEGSGELGGAAGAEALLGWALARHPAAARRVGVLTTPPEARTLVRVPPRTVAEGGAFLVGDAGGVVDPIVGCGVTIALRTGALAAHAARALLGGRPGAEVSRGYAAAFRREGTARHALATLLRRGNDHPRLARAVVALLRRTPRATRALARIASGERGPR